MPRKEFVVETPEKIVLRYALASTGSRAAAWVIDGNIRVVVTWTALFVALFSAEGDAWTRSDMGLNTGLSMAFYLIILFIVKWGYYVLFESLMRGASPGKRAMGIRAVRADGEPIDFESVVVRNLVRIVDDFPLFPLLGFLFALSTKRGQRLGDIAAGTVVVQAPKGRPVLPEEAPIELYSAAPTALAKGKASLTEAELGVLRRFLTERSRLPESAVSSMGERLAAQAEARTGIPREGRSPVEYIGFVHLAHGEAERRPAENRGSRGEGGA
jgi:uncharacterized RDD family membrane protein YckC